MSNRSSDRTSAETSASGPAVGQSAGTTMSSSSSITVERAIEFNNAGVEVAAAGYPRVAWELFKGALEVKLAVERYVAAVAPLDSAAVRPSPTSQSETGGIADATIVPVQDILQPSGESKCRQRDHNQHDHYPEREGEAGPPPPPYPSNVFIEQAECHMDRIETYTGNPMPWHHRNNLPPVTFPVRIPNGSTSTGSGHEDVMMDDAVETTADTASTSGTASTPVAVSPPDSPGIANAEHGITAAAAAGTTTPTAAIPEETLRPQYTPRLLTKPLMLEAPSDHPLVRAVRSGMESATIIFNLALLDHLNYTASEQAIALYELAISLFRTGSISNDEFFVDPLSISLLNNVAVWSYENGDIDGAQACMFKLVSIMQQHHQIQIQVQQMERMWNQHVEDGPAPAQRGAPDYWNGRSVSVVSLDDGVNDDDSNNGRTEASPHQLYNHNNNSNSTNNGVTIQMVQLFEPTEQAALESNIIWFMNPFYEASPAA